MKRLFLKIALTLVVTSSANAWHARFVGDAPIRWHSDTNTTAFKIQSTSFPGGSPFRRALNDAIRIHNQNPSQIRIALNPDTDWVSVSNGVSEIWMTDNSLVLDGAPALCVRHFNPFAIGVWYMTEADVIFNVNETYSASFSRGLYGFYGGVRRPLVSTALHELGHALGLQHEDQIYNIMGEDFTHLYVNGTLLKSGRGEDASEGLVRMYGLNTAARPDLGATHWKYLASDGEYSQHQYTWITDLSGSPLPNVMDPPEGADPAVPVFDVARGQRFQAEFTIENNGPRTESVSISYYLSTNSAISTRDRRLGSRIGVDMIRDQAETSRFTLRMPSDIAPGRYYIGVIVDSLDRVAEADEANNAAYLPVNVL